MKKLKKLFAVILSLAMVLGMSMTTFAEETKATITIDGVGGKTDTDKVTLSYIHAIKPDRNAKNGWSFTSEEIAKAYLAGFGVTIEGENGYISKTDEEKEVAKQNVINQLIEARKNPNNTDGKANSDEIAKALSNVAALTGGWTTLDTGVNSWQVTGVDAAGIYVVKALQSGYTYNNMAAYVGFDDASSSAYPLLKDVTLNAKRAEISLDKTGDPDRVSAVGEEVEYTITTIVPYIDPNATNKSYWITDMITGADYVLKDGKVDGKVQISTSNGGMEIVKDSSDNAVVITPEDNMSLIIKKDDETTEEKVGKGFSIDLSGLINPQNSNAGRTIKVTYKAKVTDLNVDNTAAAGHKSDSGYDSEYGKDDEKVYTGEITLNKTDTGTMPLADAGFEVTKNDEIVYFKKADAGVYTHVKTDDIPKDINWGTNREVQVTIKKADGTDEQITLVKEVFTKTDGTVKVQGLDVGSYKFTEKTAPKGYSINETPVTGTLEITTGDGGNGEIIEENRTVAKQNLVQKESKDQMTVKDTKLSALPSTGGIGTTIFTIGGCAIMIIAAALFFASRRKSTDAK